MVAQCDNVGISTSQFEIATWTVFVGSFGWIRIWFSQQSLWSLVRSRSDKWYWVSVSSSLDK